jgi:hypothetical protein
MAEICSDSTELKVNREGDTLCPSTEQDPQWNEMIEGTTPIPNKIIFEGFLNNPEEFRMKLMLMAIAFHNRGNKVLVDDEPVYVNEAVPMMEEFNRNLFRELEILEMAADIPRGEIKERWDSRSYKIEKP